MSRVGQTLYDKVFDRHTVRRLPSGEYQLFVALHLIHEVTSPQAFAMLRERGLGVLFPERTVATVDHIIPTRVQLRPFPEAMAEAMAAELERNVAAHGIRYFSPARGEHGIIHVLAPESGLTQPGMTLCCGDSHTSTHGAFGALAFGIGSSQVRDVLASQTVAVGRLRVRRISVDGALPRGVYAKDVALAIIRKLGARGGAGYAYEFGGPVIDRFSMDERMTVCNMSIEGGARVGYVNPDATTYAYLRGRPFAPAGAAWDAALRDWQSLRSDVDAAYADEVHLDASELEPTVTWGISPEQSIGVGGRIPGLSAFPEADRAGVEEAYAYMGLRPGQPIIGTPVDVAFVGSCTNGRASDLELVARLVERSGRRVAPNVRALVVPGSFGVLREVQASGAVDVLERAGFELRMPGCSLCLAMNGDGLEGRQLCASSSNRNFKGRQGSPEGRTLLMSPAMVAAAALTGVVSDPREVFAELGREPRENAR